MFHSKKYYHLWGKKTKKLFNATSRHNLNGKLLIALSLGKCKRKRYPPQLTVILSTKSRFVNGMGQDMLNLNHLEL